MTQYQKKVWYYWSAQINLPGKNNINNVKTEFESFFCHMQKHTENPNQGLHNKLRTKVRRTCKKF